MTAEQTKNAIETLAQSQGFYGRLLDNIESTDNPEEIYEELGQGCNDIVDLVFKLEV